MLNWLFSIRIFFYKNNFNLSLKTYWIIQTELQFKFNIFVSWQFEYLIISKNWILLFQIIELFQIPNWHRNQSSIFNCLQFGLQNLSNFHFFIQLSQLTKTVSNNWLMSSIFVCFCIFDTEFEYSKTSNIRNLPIENVIQFNTISFNQLSKLIKLICSNYSNCFGHFKYLFSIHQIVK